MEFSSESFDACLTLLARFNPSLADELKAPLDNRFLHFRLTNGEPNLFFQDDSHSYYLHEPTGAQLEANRWAASLNLSAIDVIYNYGVGLGYQYEALLPWLKEDPTRQLVFLEDDLAVLPLLFGTERGVRLLKDTQVNFYSVRSAEEKPSLLFELAQDYTFRNGLVAALPSYAHEKSSFFSLLMNRLSFEMSEQKARNQEMASFGVLFFNNFYHNLLRLPASFQGQALFGKFKGVPAIICGAGPSLNQSLPLLKTLGDRALLFGPGSSMNSLNSAHIWPHFGVNIDPTPETFHRQIMNKAFETPTFYMNRLYHEVLPILHGSPLYLPVISFYPLTQWFDRQLHLPSSLIKGGYNVVNLTIELAYHLGCDPIILVGTDLCFAPGQHYAAGVERHPLFPNPPDQSLRGEPFQVKNRLGHSVQTYWPWIMQAHWIDAFHRNHPSVRLLNATEEGIDLFSVPYRSLNDIFTKELTQSYDLPTRIHDEIQQAGLVPVNQEQIVSTIKTFYESLKTCKQICLDLLEVVPTLTALDRLDEKKLEQEEAFIYCLKPFNIFYLRFTSVEQKTISRLDGKEERLDLYKQIEKERYLFLLETIDIHCAIIEKRLRNNQELSPYFLESPIELKDDSLSLGGKAFYYRSGRLYYVEPNKEEIREGRHLYYHENGTLKTEMNYTQGKLDGPVRLYYPNGQLERELFFKEGLRHGTEKSWHRNGQLFTEIEYRFNEPKKAYCWTLDGKLVKEIIK